MEFTHSCWNSKSIWQMKAGNWMKLLATKALHWTWNIWQLQKVNATGTNIFCLYFFFFLFPEPEGVYCCNGTYKMYSPRFQTVWHVTVVYLKMNKSKFYNSDNNYWKNLIQTCSINSSYSLELKAFWVSEFWNQFVH